jgi:hypothetical protein
MTDEYLTLSEAPRHIPGRPSASAVWRWCRDGVKARNGERVRLQHVRAGARIFTTRAWLDEFMDKLAAADAEYFAAPPGPGPSEPVTRRGRTVQEREAEAAAARARIAGALA